MRKSRETIRMDKIKLPFYSKKLPLPTNMVVFRVLEFDDMVVRCILPEFMDVEAMLPTTEIKIKRGKKVRDYIKVRGEYVGEVSRVQYPTEQEGGSPKIDLSMKGITVEETKGIFTKYARMNKVLQVVGGASDYKQVAAESMLLALTTAASVNVHDRDLFAFCEQILLTGNTVNLPVLLIESIRQRIPMPSFTVEKEIEIKFISEVNAVEKISAILDKISKMDGLSVHVVAPPKYKIIAVASSKAKAEEMVAPFDDLFYLLQLFGTKKKKKAKGKFFEDI